jgi:LPXTG-motif cell wall-anchored protein
MNVLWSLVLLASVAFSIAVPLFFGHALIAHDNKWFMLAGLCLLIAGALMFVQVRFRRDREHVHH